MSCPGQTLQVPPQGVHQYTNKTIYNSGAEFPTILQLHQYFAPRRDAHVRVDLHDTSVCAYACSALRYSATACLIRAPAAKAHAT
jgi:hypothetical protein